MMLLNYPLLPQSPNLVWQRPGKPRPHGHPGSNPGCGVPTAKKGKIFLRLVLAPGLNLPYYPEGVQVVGIDVSRAMLKQAKRKDSKAKVSLKLMNASKTSFQKNHFDS